MPQIPENFRDSNYELVPYDGSAVSWRVSLYGVCIIDEQLLLIKHKDEKFYDVPGGGIEMDETLEQALERESIEEAGWSLKTIRPILVKTDWFYHTEEARFYKSLQIYFEATGKQKLAAPTDQRIRFVELVPLKRLAEYELYPNLREAVELLDR
ncbi:MAG: NUDIX domain-containing protein [Patescibacteria group bacterium]